MALEMQVYREIKGYEAKVMMGMSWRQLGAMALGVPIAGTVFALVAVLAHHAGRNWGDATNLAFIPMFFALVPFAAWGWWRPKSLKPEQFLGYLIRHHFTKKVVPYVDTYQPESVPGTKQRARAAARDADAGESLAEPGGSPRDARRAARAARQAARFVPQEFPEATRRRR